jgi:hypothetical protein
MKLLFVHDPRQPKIRNQQIGIVFGRPEEKILGLEIAVHDTVVVEICDGGEGRADQVCSVRLVVVALTTYAVEQLAAEREVGYEVYCDSVSV